LLQINTSFFPILPGISKADGVNTYNEDGRATGWKYWEMEDTSVEADEEKSLKKLRPSKDYDKIPKLNPDYEDLNNEVRDVDPWWEKMISNRH
jgi:hypothetical protein